MADRRLDHRRRHLGHVARHRLVLRQEGRRGDGSQARRRHRDGLDDRSWVAHGADPGICGAPHGGRGGSVRRRAVRRPVHSLVHHEDDPAAVRAGIQRPWRGPNPMSTRIKVFASIGGILVLAGIIGALAGSARRNGGVPPQEEFKLEDWVGIHLGGVNLSITRAVLYLAIAAILTTVAMLYIANRMQSRPNRVQTAVETLYLLMRDNITRGNMDDSMARKWFPFIGTLFLFIWFSNLIGYIPLPTNTQHKISVFGLRIPAFAIYSATANISIPLVLALMVWFAYHLEGIRAMGPRKYLASWIPAGTPKA